MRRLEEERQAEEDRLTASLAGLAVTLALLVVSLFVIERLAAASRIEDCLLAQRLNCVPVDSAALDRSDLGS